MAGVYPLYRCLSVNARAADACVIDSTAITFTCTYILNHLQAVWPSVRRRCSERRNKLQR